MAIGQRGVLREAGGIRDVRWRYRSLAQSWFETSEV